MFTKKGTHKFRRLLQGVSMRPLAVGEQSNLCEFVLEKGATLPPHQHPYEQTGCLLSGKLNFKIGGEWQIAEPGDSWSIPKNVEHEVEIIEDSVVFELFSPLRPDYLP